MGLWDWYWRRQAASAGLDATDTDALVNAPSRRGETREQRRERETHLLNEIRAANRGASREWNAIKGTPPPIYQNRIHDASYSGCDIIPVINTGKEVLILGNVQAISYSIHRNKKPVYTCGRSYPKGFTRGERTIAGTIIFTVFNEHVLSKARSAFMNAEVDQDGGVSSILTDQLPPFDITITYGNEYGFASYMRIYGIDIFDEGQVHSVDDMQTENVMQYVAKDIDLMCSYADPTSAPQERAFRRGIFYARPDSSIDNTITNLEKIKGDLVRNITAYKQRIYDLGVEDDTLDASDPTENARKLVIADEIAEIRKLQRDAEAELTKVEAQVLNLQTASRYRSKDNPYDYSIR